MGNSVNNLQPALKKLLRWLCRGFLAVIILLLVLFACVYIYLQRDPDALVAKYLGEVETRTGLKFDIGAIDVTLLPLPAVGLSDVSITGKDLNFTAAWVSARPGFLRILRGDFMPASVTILRPCLSIKTDLPLDNPGEALEKLNFAGQSSDAELPALDLHIQQLALEISGSSSSKVAVSGLNAQVSLAEAGEINGVVNLPALRILQNNTQLIAVENLRITGKTNIFSFFDSTHGLAVSAMLRWRGVFKSCDFKGEFGSSSSGWDGRIALAAIIDFGKSGAPLKLQGRALRLANHDEIVLRGLDWQLGPDSGTLDLACQLKNATTPFALRGTLLAHRLSLTEWFGFARNLTPGLQIALDTITRARLEFILSEKGVEVPKIHASCSGSSFTGKGGVPDWSKPVVRLDLHTPLANLLAALPEAAAETPDSPWYNHPSLTPLPTEPLHPGETPIGYDIRLSADKLLYGPVKFERAALQIYPGKLDVTGFQDVLLDASGSFYGGSVTGHCILGADPSLPYYITTTAKNINGAALAKDMTILPFRQGRFEATATVTSKSKQLEPFLANLKGNLKTTGKDVTLGATGNDLAFSTLSAGLRLRSAAWNGKKLSFDGQWSASAKTNDFSADCSLNGRIPFGQGGVNFTGLPGLIQASFANGPLPQGAKIKLQGKFGANQAQEKLEIAAATLEAFGQKISGDVKVDASKGTPAFHGNLRTSIPDLGKVLAQAGYKSATIPEAYRSLKIESAISGQPGALRLTKLRASLGKTELSGSLQWQKPRDRNHFEADLTLNAVNFAESAKKNKTPDWNFRNLATFDAKGKIRVRQANIWDLRCSNVNLAFNLENGKLSIAPMTADFYDSVLNCSATADFKQGLIFSARLQAQAFNLGKAAQDHKLKTLLRGSASLEAKLNAKLSGHMEIVKAMQGNWSFNIRDGSWQSLNKKGEPQGKPTDFTSISAAGTIASGLLKSDNFLLLGKGLNVGGNGSLNLASQQLECNFNVDMKGWPDFPLRIYGPLSSIKTSFGAGKFALNAIGEAVGGFTNAIGGLIKGAVNIFR